MSTENNGGPAFPVHPDIGTQEPHAGMTLRDYFAAKAMQVELGRLAGQFNDQTTDFDCWEDAQEYAASMAYSMADAMLKAREAAPQEN